MRTQNPLDASPAAAQLAQAAYNASTQRLALLRVQCDSTRSAQLLAELQDCVCEVSMLALFVAQHQPFDRHVG